MTKIGMEGLANPGYTHFAVSGSLMLAAYFVAVFSGYGNLRSAVIGFLVMLSVDTLWQVPFFARDWTASLQGAEFGLTTGAWSLISIPALLIFVQRGRKERPRFAEAASLAVAMAFTVIETASPWDPYLLSIPWAAFFLIYVRTNVSAESIIPPRPHSPK